MIVINIVKSLLFNFSVLNFIVNLNLGFIKLLKGFFRFFRNFFVMNFWFFDMRILFLFIKEVSMV